MKRPSLTLDYRHIRADDVCPFCNSGKEQGLITCWPCYRAHGMRNGLTASDATILEYREQRLIEIACC